MRFFQIIRTAFKNLRANKTRSVLTISGIGVGIGAIVFLVSLGYGLQELTTKRIASIGAITTLDIGSPKQGSSAKLDRKTIKDFEGIDKVDKISPLLSTGAKGEIDSKKTDIVINAVNDYFFSMEGVRPSYGAVFANSEDQIVLSTAAVKALNKGNEEILNKKVKMNVALPTEGKETEAKEGEFTVIGIVQDDTSSFAYFPLTAIDKDLPESVVYNSAKVKVSSREDINNVRTKIEGMGFAVTSIADTISQVDQTFRIIQIILACFGAIALLVAAIGMFNTMTIALLERTRDIGVMKAIGIRNKDVYRMFLSESTLIAFSGGVFGLVGGFLISKLINLAVNGLARSVGGEAQKLFATPYWLAIGIVVFAILVGVLTGYYPSRRASKINPLDALRYE